MCAVTSSRGCSRIAEGHTNARSSALESARTLLGNEKSAAVRGICKLDVRVLVAARHMLVFWVRKIGYALRRIFVAGIANVGAGQLQTLQRRVGMLPSRRMQIEAEDTYRGEAV